MYYRWLVVILLINLCACAADNDIFPDISDNIASPSDISISGNRMYVVNSNAEVKYDWKMGNFQVYDITDPLSPVLIKNTETSSFSGQIYLDTIGDQAFVPNRFSEDDTQESDTLYTFSIDESNADDFASYTESDIGLDAFAIACCYPDNQAWVSTSLSEVHYFNLETPAQTQSMSLLVNLDDGSEIVNAATYHMVLNGNQLFASRYYGGVLIANLDDAGQEGVVPVDYFIEDIGAPRGIAYEVGTEKVENEDVEIKKIYVLGEGTEDGTYKRYIAILNVTELTPLADNTTAQRLDKDDDSLLIKLIEVGTNPQEILLTDDYIFVSNMDDNTVSVVNKTSYAIAATIDVGDSPYALALYEDAGVDTYVYVGNLVDNSISIIDIDSLAVVKTVMDDGTIE